MNNSSSGQSPVTAEPMPFYIVWSAEGGELRQCYSDPLTAEVAAEAMAGANPGVEFFVCQILCGVKAGDIAIRRFRNSAFAICRESATH